MATPKQYDSGVLTQDSLIGTEFVEIDAGYSKKVRTTVQDIANLGGNAASVNTQPGTSYTLLPSDNGRIMYFTAGSSIILTIPADLGEGFQCLVIQGDIGQVALAAAGGSHVTVHNSQSFTQTAGQYAVLTLVAVADDTFIFSGDGA